MKRLPIALFVTVIFASSCSSDKDPVAIDSGWEEVTPMNQPTTGQAIKMHDGKVLVAGGNDVATKQFTTHGEIYDDNTKTWTNLTSGVAGNTRLYSLTNGDIIAVHSEDGGGSLNVSRLKKGELGFQTLGQIPILMASGFIPNYNDLLELPDGTVVITAFNKITLIQPGSSTLELYSDPKLGSEWFVGATILGVSDRKFLVIADLDESNGLDGVFRVWDAGQPFSNVVEDFDYQASWPYYMLNKYRIDESTWLVAGGLNGLNVRYAASKARLINVVTGEVKPADETILPAMDPPFYGPSAIFPLSDGRIYIVSQNFGDADHRIYDPVAKKFAEGNGYLRYNENKVPIVPDDMNVEGHGAASVAITGSEEIFVTTGSGKCWILRKN